MKKTFITSLFIIILFFAFVKISYADIPTISYSPTAIMQGDPFVVSIGGVEISQIKRLTFAGSIVPVFLYQGKPTAFIGVDLNKKPAIYKLRMVLLSGKIISKNVTIFLRQKIDEPLGIPQKLGGDTTQSQSKMVDTLIAENKTLANINTATSTLWTNDFILPLQNIFITDPYGYSRQTGAYSIPHKGVDYKAAIGTKVTAINSGIVRIVHGYTDYGNTIVIDHGLGVMSFYLHLSKINVKVGDSVTRGQIIGLSGDSGYTMGPHLHLSIRINNVSIDPVKFFNLFQ